MSTAGTIAYMYGITYNGSSSAGGMLNTNIHKHRPVYPRLLNARLYYICMRKFHYYDI